MRETKLRANDLSSAAKTRLCKALLLAFGGATVATGAVAQQQLERVEITGSAIKRVDAETAVPITVLHVDDLKKEGVSTVEQLVQRLANMQQQQSTSQVVGLGTGGASFADLRGLGANKTLVLLNGRRVANNALDSSAPDLNTIPFAAIERVEVLRDGASSLYGTDAIGGVINFITRRDFQGGTFTIGGDIPEKKGGKSQTGNVGFGFGDLDKDRVNVLAFLDYNHQEPISGTDRDFNSRNLRPSPTPFPANYFQNGNSFNPLGPACADPFLLQDATKTGCQFIPGKFIDYVPRTERISGFLGGTLALGDGHRLRLEYFGTRTEVQSNIAPVPFGNLTVDPGTAFYPGNGITPAPPAGSGIDTTMPLHVRFRDVPNGPRAGDDLNYQQRLVLALDGTLAGWDYQTGLTYNTNKVHSNLVGGYADGSIITAGVKSGVINPFGAQTAAGTALLASALTTGNVLNGFGKVYGGDARVSRELGDWFQASRPAALAVGAEVRRETFKETANADFAAQVIASTGIDPATDNEGSRNVFATYLELNVPLLKSLEVTAAVRYDKYSDFGSTTNPKLSFRYTPMQSLLLRGSASTGFRAPSLYDLNSAQTFTNTAATWNDPVLCPGGQPKPGVSAAVACGQQFIELNGGNKGLKPEKSKSATIGLVFEPAAGTSFSVDYWTILISQTIGPAGLPDATIFGDPVKYAGLFHRAPDGTLATDGSQCPGTNCGYILNAASNFGKIATNGLDFNASYRLRAGAAGNFAFNLNSTYVHRYDYQNEEGGPYFQNVGIYSGAGPIFRWQHSLTTSWSLGAWGAGVAGRFKSGYLDATPPNEVASYTVFDVYGTWQPTKALQLTLGVKNVFDRDPPFSNQLSTFAVGYDPRFAEVTGRAYYFRGTYNF